jgi:cytochrome b subunit of formate dehydrogenase
MKSYNTIYYLLFVLLIMGAFASMAQNSYGLTLLGGVAISFGLLFLYQFFKSLQQQDRKVFLLPAELLALFVISILFALRTFHIYVPFSEVLFALAGLVLVFVYGKKMLQRYGVLKSRNNKAARLSLVYHLSLILFIISLIAAPILPQLYVYFGVAAFILLIVFLILGLLVPHYLMEGSEVSVFKLVSTLKDRSLILLSLFFIISIYMGLTRIGVLPAMYSDEYPQAYFKLVNNAEAGKEKGVDGKASHQEFKERYENFLERNITKTP